MKYDDGHFFHIFKSFHIKQGKTECWITSEIYTTFPQLLSDSNWGRVIWIRYHFDGLVQERRNSSALAMELRLSCTIPSVWYMRIKLNCVYSIVSHCNADMISLHRNELNQQTVKSIRTSPFSYKACITYGISHQHKYKGCNYLSIQQRLTDAEI